MRKSIFSENQIVGSIKQSEAGIPAQEISRDLSISRATFYKWKSKYGGLEASDLRRLKEPEAESNVCGGTASEPGTKGRARKKF